jgi:hypothetical protein
MSKMTGEMPRLRKMSVNSLSLGMGLNDPETKQFCCDTMKGVCVCVCVCVCAFT